MMKNNAQGIDGQNDYDKSIVPLYQSRSQGREGGPKIPKQLPEK